MSRRTLASTLVFCLLLALVAVAAFLPVPYVTMSPGPTVNVLGSSQDKPIIDVRGARTYPTTGDLRLTTVSVTNPTRRIGLAETLKAWLDPKRAVYPRDVIYPPDQTADAVQQQSNVEMVSSQDTAIAAALHELGYKLPLQIEVLAVTKKSPADGRLETRDRILRVNGTPIRSVKQVTQAIQRSGVGKPATFVVRRGAATKTLRVTPKAAPDDPKRAMVGVQIGTGYDFPFDVSVRLGEDIGGPSAGLIFSLGVVRPAHPRLADRRDRHRRDGNHRRARTRWSHWRHRAEDRGRPRTRVPRSSSCRPPTAHQAEKADVKKDQIRLVKAPTMHSAVQSLRAYAADKNADLPACG